MTPLVFLLLLPDAAWSEERNRFADVLALQEAIHQSIERAEPSIACVLVSRSDKYQPHTPTHTETPGKLGRFDLRGARAGFTDRDPEWKAIGNLDLSNPNVVPESYGSGVVLDEKEGLILTLAHVVRKAVKIYVRLPGNRGSWADIHAADPRSDLAVLRLLDPPHNLKALKLGDGGKLRKGDFLLSLSNPFAAGFRDGSPSASWGIVSNLRRRSTGMLSEIDRGERRSQLPLHCFGTLVQTDTRLNLGCSGGALLNLQGELVGLTSALAGISGGETPGGFAMPLDPGLRRIIDVLRRGEEVEYGFLGVYLRAPDQMPDGFVQIDGVVPEGPAARGSLRSGMRSEGGDFILSINGTPVHNNDDLFLVVGMHLAGSTVRIEAASRPNGPRRTCTVTLAKYPVAGQIIASKRPPARGGLRVDWTSTLSMRWRNLRKIPEGVVIREVVPNSAADKARLQPDMIIKSVNDHKVMVPADFYRAMAKANGPVELTLLTSDLREERVTLDSK